MADEQRQRDRAQLGAAIDSLSDSALKTHMLTALRAFETSASSTQSMVVQQEKEKDDAIAVKLRDKSATVHEPRDALFLAVHVLLLEAGYKLTGTVGSEFALPEDWDVNRANGLYQAEYVHPNDDSIKFSLQGLVVGGKLQVYVSDDKDHTHSIELSVDKHVASSKSTSPLAAADVLRDLKTLRETVAPFAERIRPAKKKEKPASAAGRPAFVQPPPNRDDRGGASGIPSSPARIPSVGSGDVFPPGLGGSRGGGGGGNRDMLVGPDHPLFGHRRDPSMGPVPGARFDPFGPPMNPLGPSGLHGPPSRGPAPLMPFGGPGPDHLRMPRDDDMAPDFGGLNGRGSRSRGSDFSQPFGANHSFF
ncbi:unnamed protein product [Hyaloperonospora brassicae]|uniref:PI31 proteasome regulator N-terminal domain-containing protein n=1 Tax=Hyaloperonospora brassicae TaxID=162125 RepID=A0AAV0UMR8_HYABA|nr:unnamed protein product [Hyaloperonospora brassicae]